MKYTFLLIAVFIVLSGCNSGKNGAGEDSSKRATPSSAWLGEWTRYIRQYGGVLNVSKVIKDSIAFELFANSGANTGQTEGMAVVEGNKAAYFSLEGNDTCIIAFELFGDSLISVEQVKGSCLTGIGVVYSGSYYSAKYAAAKSMDKDKKVQLLDDAADNALLKKLVGSEYDVFVSTTQQTTEDTDVDNFNAKVYTSGVAGLFTLMENIIIINANKDIWAAVINDSVIDYYTTRPDYYSKLPITIDKWRSRFEEDKIIYKSHK